MHCTLSSPDGVKYCVDLIFPWASMLLGLVGLILVLFNLGATSAVAYFLRNARRHEREMEAATSRAGDAEQRYKELAGIVSGPLTQYQTLVLSHQEAQQSAAQWQLKYTELISQFEQFRALKGGDSTQATAAVAEAADRARALERNHAEMLKAVSLEAEAFWSRPVEGQYKELLERLKDSIPILLFANQKGGVGKTTLSANLAAYFQSKGENVLAIDLDYQGTMTIMMSRQAGLDSKAFRSTVDVLFQRELPQNWLDLAKVTLSKRMHYMSCHYTFEKVERSLEYEWLIGGFRDDVRFRLARALLTPEVQTSYDRIIIDTPPRFTSGFLNAFCASTHLIIPTIVDDPSLNAVGHFVNQFAVMKQSVNPQLRLAGIVGVRTTNVQDHRLPQNHQARADAADVAARRALGTKDATYFIRDAVIRNYPSLAIAAEKGIAYLQDETTQPMFDNLGRRIAVLAPRRQR